ncbi:MAG: cob(I)yrinic acid a,c-diamide adenosyltransferase [Nannocystaceae bacterium]|nr:cob(I)yrinic acid a,c-diamide adenosyltransferase [Nannocystaceae bacterium]
MVYISKVYTKAGDGGKTMLASGESVPKDHLRIRSYGDIDELNATIGMVRVELAREPGRDDAKDFVSQLDAQLGRIQQELFNLGAELSFPEPTEPTDMPRLCLGPKHVEMLEHDIDGWNDALEPLRSFILPGGGAVAAACHVSRTVCRRAEREVVSLANAGEQVSEVAIKYVNRLSDYFFVASRAASSRLGYAETLWVPETT